MRQFFKVYERQMRRHIIDTGLGVALLDHVWDGGGADDKWATSENWVIAHPPTAQDRLFFNGNVRTSPVNDVVVDTPLGIAFNVGADPFTLSGNQFVLSKSIRNYSPNLQTIDNNIKVNDVQDVTGIGLSAGHILINGVISGVGGIAVSSDNEYTDVRLYGLNTFTGKVSVDRNNLVVNTWLDGGVPCSFGGQSVASGNIEIVSTVIDSWIMYNGLSGSTNRGFTVTNNGITFGVVMFLSTVNFTISGIIAGTGFASFAGNNSVVTLTGLNTVVGIVANWDVTVKVDTLYDAGVPCAGGAGPSMGTFNPTATLEYTGPTTSTNKDIFGPGVFKVSTPGVLTLTGTSTMTGSVLINTGVLSVGAAGNLGDSSCEVNFSTTGQLKFTGSFTCTNELHAINSGQINVDIPAGITVNQSANVQSYNHANPVVKNGDGTWILSADNTQLDSDLWQYAGVIDLRHNGAVGNTSTDDVHSKNPNLTVRLTKDTTLALTGGLRPEADGTTYVVDRVNAGSSVTHTVNDISTNGAYTVNFAVGSGITSGTAGFTVRGTTTMGGNTVFNAPATMTVTFTGAIDGAHNLTVQGGSTFIVLGTASYNGVTTIAAGTTLQVGNGATSGSIATSSNIVNNGALVYNINAARTYANVISGSGTLTKQGSDTLTLTGTNLYTGVTTISAGTLSIGSGGATGSIASSSGVTNNATLIYNITGTRTYANVISGTGALTKQGAGTLILTGTNLYSGVTTVTTGTLQLGNGVTDGTIDSTSSIANAAAVVFNVVGNLSFAKVISGVGSVTKTGAGTLTLTVVNTYSGSTVVESGTLNLSSARVAASGTIRVYGGATLNITTGTYALGNNSFYVGEAGNGIVNQSGGSVTFGTAGVELLLGNGASPSIGTYNLSGGSMTTGANTIYGILLGVNPGCTGIFNLSGTGVLQMTSGGNSVLNIGRNDHADGNNCTAQFIQTGGTATIGALSIGGNGSTGLGEVCTLDISAGTFSAASFARLAAGNTNTCVINISGTADVTLPAFPTARGTSSTATLNMNGGTLRSAAASTAWMGSLTNAFIKAGGITFNIAASRDIIITQVLKTDPVSLGGGITKNGVGWLTLNATNTFTGGVTVNAGRVRLGNGVVGTENVAGLGTGIVTVNTGGQLYLDPGSTGTTYSIANSFVLNGGTIIGEDGVQRLATGVGATFVIGASGGTIQASWVGKDVYIDGVVSGSTTLAISHGPTTGSQAGVHFTNAANSFSGTVTVTSSGQDVSLNLNSITALQYGTVSLVKPSGGNPYLYINTAGATTIIAGLTGSNGIVQTATGAGTYTLNVNNAVDNSFGGVLRNNTGVLALTKSGNGTLTLTGANTYTGTTTISGGTLKLNSTSFTPVARNYSIGTGAVLEINGNTGIPSGTTTISGAGTLRITSGTISNGVGAGRVVAVSLGSGGLLDIQAGAILYNGGWTAFTWASNLGSMKVDGSFDLADADASVDALTGAGTVVKTQAGTHTLTVGVNNGSGTFTGVISNATGTLALTKSGSGAQVLTNANTYTGATTISGGTLQITGSLGNTAVAVNAGGTLLGRNAVGLSATITGAVTVANSATAIIQPGSVGDNTLNTGALTFSGSSAKLLVNSTATTFSKISVTGNVALGGCTIDFPAGITTDGTYKLITATGTMTGTLPVIGTNSTGKTLVLQQTGNDLEVVVS
jgi:autotransporter-associated beta strand protein